jgi:phage gp45-like
MIKSLIRWAVVTSLSDDDKDFPIHQVGYLGKAADAVAWYPFGFHANASEDSLALMFAVESNAENRVILPGSPKERLGGKMPTPLAEGEVIMYHPETKSYVHMKADGSIDVNVCKNLNLTVTGNVVADVEGAVSATVEGNVTVDSEGIVDITAAGDLCLESETGDIKLTASAGQVLTDSATFQSSTTGLWRANSDGNIDLILDTTGGLVNLGGTGGRNVGRKTDSADFNGSNEIDEGSTQVLAIDGSGGPA